MATIGLLLGVGLVAGFYALGIAGAKSVGGDQTAERLRRGFVHSLVPIALVYVVAHYLTFFLFEGQAIFALASDPLGEGWDLFGTASSAIDFGLISQNQTWYLQVGFVVAGHVAALILAHERALVLYNQATLAVRSQYWMLAIMVGFTTLALWLLAQAGTAAAVKEASPAPQDRASPPRSSSTSRSSRRTSTRSSIDPASGDFLLTTNRGFWRIDTETEEGHEDHRHRLRQGQEGHRRHLPARQERGRADADRLRPPGPPEHAAAVHRLHALRGPRQDVEGRLAPRRHATCTRSSSSTTSSTRSTRCCRRSSSPATTARRSASTSRRAG